MKIKRYVISAVKGALLLMLPMLGSCRTEICYNHFPAADISFSWEREWERDYGMGHSAAWDADFYGVHYDDLRPETPEWVSLIRYSADGEVTNEKYLPPEGGRLILSTEGDKSFLAYNSNTEYIVVEDVASLSSARATATTRTRASLSYIIERYPGIRSMNAPDVLYAAYVDHVPKIPVHETTPMPIRMQPLVFTYVVRYEFEQGMEYIGLARGAIAGMAESVYLRDGRTSKESAIILYDCELKPYGCEALVRSFGVPDFPDAYYGRTVQEESERPHTLNLEILLKNGKTMEFNFDITDQLKKQPRGGVITVSGLRVEEEQAKPDPVNSGFDVDLVGWGAGIDVELPTGTQ